MVLEGTDNPRPILHGFASQKICTMKKRSDVTYRRLIAIKTATHRLPFSASAW
jgi:hypothetical protein